MKIEMHGLYDHFPNHVPDIPFEPSIDCYNDHFCMICDIAPNSIALLIEPRSIQPGVYEWIEQNYKKFKYVFTHDSRLLKICDNAKLILWGMGNSNYNSFNDVKKTKYISMVSSDKEMCELHIARKELAMKFKNNPYVDTMGTFDGGLFKNTFSIYAEYKFSVAIENYVDDYWFTEKICNCFANKTMPIYVGARKINEFFNPKGIIQLQTTDEVYEWITKIQDPKYLNKQYYTNEDAINDNYERVRKFADFEKWFFDEYGEMLDEQY